LIPVDLFRRLSGWEILVEVGLVQVTEEGAYCCGARERWAFLTARSEAGKASVTTRRAKFGTAVPFGAPNRTKSKQTPNSAEQTPNSAEQTPNSAEPSSSSLFPSLLLTKKAEGERGVWGENPTTIYFLNPPGKWNEATDEATKTWITVYPHVNVEAELRHAAEWLKADWPKRAKKNWHRFLVAWLKRAEDDATGRRGREPTPQARANWPKGPRW
jgi:hypothetical protein